jgi:hypothetical protein
MKKQLMERGCVQRTSRSSLRTFGPLRQPAGAAAGAPHTAALRWFVFALLVMVGVTSAHAHPGHDLFEHGTTHVVASPFHLLVLVSLGIALAAATRFARNTRARIILRLGATACVALAAALALLR